MDFQDGKVTFHLSRIPVCHLLQCARMQQLRTRGRTNVTMQAIAFYYQCDNHPPARVHRLLSLAWNASKAQQAGDQ